jgi:WD40 repeat protein
MVAFGSASSHLIHLPKLSIVLVRNVVNWLDSLFNVNIPGCPFWNIGWSDSGLVAVSGKSGNLAAFNVKKKLDNLSVTQEQCFIFNLYLHSSVITKVSWLENDHGKFIITSGTDGVLKKIDLMCPLNPVVVTKSQGIIRSFCATQDAIVFADSAHNVKVAYGNGKKHFYQMQSHASSVWSVAVCNFFPLAASCGADGNCILFNMEKNGTKRGASTQCHLFSCTFTTQHGKIKFGAVNSNFVSTIYTEKIISLASHAV